MTTEQKLNFLINVLNITSFTLMEAFKDDEHLRDHLVRAYKDKYKEFGYATGFMVTRSLDLEAAEILFKYLGNS